MPEFLKTWSYYMENMNVNWTGEMMCIATLPEVHRPANWSVGFAGQIMQYTDTAQCMMSCKWNLVLLYTTTNFRNTPTYRTTASASFVIIIHAYRTTASVSFIWWLSMFAVDLLDDAMKSAGPQTSRSAWQGRLWNVQIRHNAWWMSCKRNIVRWAQVIQDHRLYKHTRV